MTWIKDRVGTAAMAREMDRRAMAEFGIPGIVLMENAGRGAFETIMAEFKPCCVNVLCGKGNNGGDGCVIARHLQNAGVKVRTFLFARREEIKDDARVNLEALLRMSGAVNEVLDPAALEDFRLPMTDCDLIVDALLGTGLQDEVRGFLRDAIDFINGLTLENRALKIFAVDLPSGLHADTGQVLGAAIRADATATFGVIKAGLLSFPGAELGGRLFPIDISFPRELYADLPYRLITPEWAAKVLPPRRRDFHKGSAGHGLVLAGSPGKTGAAAMAAEAGLRGGAGLITLAGPAGVHDILEQQTLEVMTEPLPEGEEGCVGVASIDRALELMAGKTAVALGPGLGRGRGVKEFVRAVLRECRSPLVIDADGLNALAEDPAALAGAGCPIVLTPHPGEMGRLIGRDAKAVLADRLGVAERFARERRVTLVLKGAHTLIAGPEGRVRFNLTGNPGMATGGSGDVLTGLLLGLLCRGLEVEDAAALGVYLHGRAGDLAAEDQGEEGMIACDILAALPRAFLELRGPAR